MTSGGFYFVAVLHEGKDDENSWRGLYNSDEIIQLSFFLKF